MHPCCTTIERTPATRAEQTSGPVKRVSFFRPAVDVIEEATEFRITADVPGASAEGVALEFENGELTLTVRIPPRTRPNAAGILTEYEVGDFRRIFRVGETIDTAKASAELRDGVLSVRLPKSEAAQRRRIPVNAS